MQRKYIDAYNEYVNDPFTTIKELGVKYGFCDSSFYRAIKKHNVVIPSGIYKTTASREKLESAVSLYQDGFSIKAISNNLSMGERTISRYLEYRKIPIRFSSQKRTDLHVNSSYFKIIDSEDKAYWLGFIYADGSISTTNKSRLVIELATIDDLHLEKFKEDIGSNHDVKYRKNRNVCSVSIHCKELIDDLAQYGCAPNKMKQNISFIELIDKQYYAPFLRGYLDGDGYIDKTRYRIIYTTSSHTVAMTLICMLREHSIDFKIRKESSYFRVLTENKKGFFDTLNLLYNNATIYLDRKYDIFLDRTA